ncbi:MAG TPA: hypothetical protein VGD41_16000, partial [Pyrinomonadaceae bacterium]
VETWIHRSDLGRTHWHGDVTVHAVPFSGCVESMLGLGAQASPPASLAKDDHLGTKSAMNTSNRE